MAFFFVMSQCGALSKIEFPSLSVVCSSEQTEACAFLSSHFPSNSRNMKIPGIATERLSSIFSKQSRLMQSTDAFNVKAIYNETKDLNRVAIITGKKKIGKSAVHRNRADRRIKSALQTIYPNLKMKGSEKQNTAWRYVSHTAILARL